MSRAACAKKTACNPPVKAAVEVADRLLAAIERGDIPAEVGVIYLRRQIPLDETYCADSKEASGWLVAALEALESDRKPPPPPWL